MERGGASAPPRVGRRESYFLKGRTSEQMENVVGCMRAGGCVVDVRCGCVYVQGERERGV